MIEGLEWVNDPCHPIDTAAMEAARLRQDDLTKPQGSLGRLEEIAIRLCGMQGTATPTADPVRVLQFVSDHGVATEGVSLYPRVVTLQMLRNIAEGGAAVSVMAKDIGAVMDIYDLGAVSDPGPIDGVRSERLGPGTGNIACEPAMTEAQLVRALNIGRDAVDRAFAEGVKVVIGGEMGIGNTTPATALSCALLGLDAAAMTGPGTGLDANGVSRKAQVVAKALELHAEPGLEPLELLRRLGGFDTAACTGVYVRAAQRGIAIMVDGFIVSSAALTAVRLNPQVRDWMFFSHGSAEPGHRHMMAALDADPLLHLRLRLGEATGGLAAIPLLRMACAIHRQMATFSEAGVSGPVG